MTTQIKKERLFKLTPIAACVLVSMHALAQEPVASDALPTGGSVVSGQATWSANGGQMVIDQASQRVDTTWSNFNIGRDAAVTVQQPNANSQFIGRVTGSNASYIMGGLQANGQVVLVNPNGMVFGRNSQVNVGGLIASTQRMSALTREEAELQFHGPSGLLRQEGQIDAGYVALIGAQIEQDGSIRASGDVVMASGDQVQLALNSGGELTVSVDASDVNASIDQTGAISTTNGTVVIEARAAQSLLTQAVSGAESASELVMVDGKLQLIRSGGEISADRVELDAGDTGQTEVSGSIEARTVEVLGGAVSITSSATIDVSDSGDAGEIRVGGSWQNQDPSVRQAETARVAQGAVLRADSTELGDAGQIVVWSDVLNPNSLTVVAGVLSAQANDGRGGQIETSGASLELGQIDVSAQGLEGDGLWLLDPTVWSVGSSEATNIVTALASANVEITTTDSPPDYTSNGGTNPTEVISVDAPIVSTSTAGNYLLFNSGGDVRVTEQISLASGDLIIIAAEDIWLHNSTSSSDDAVLLSGAGATLTLSAGGQTLNTSVAPPSDLTSATGSGSSIDVDNLRLTGGGDFALLANTNAIGSLASDSVGVLRINNESALTIGTVTTSGLSSAFSATNGTSSGITSDDLVQINTQAGDLSVTQSVTSTATNAQTVRLSAGQASAFNVETGGDVVFSGSGGISTNNVTTGPGALVLTGSFAGSTSAAALTGVENDHLRFASNLGNISSRLAFSDTTGIALAYREYPTASIILTNGTDGVIDAGENTHEYTAAAARNFYVSSDEYQYRFVSSDFNTLDNDSALVSRLESDVVAIATQDTSLPYIILNRTQSSSFHTNAGTYSIVADLYQETIDSNHDAAGSASWLEYTPSGVKLAPQASTVTITPKELLIQTQVNDRHYNGSDVAAVNLIATGVDGAPIEGVTDPGQLATAQTFANGVVKNDSVTLTATGVFDSKNVAYNAGSVVAQNVTVTPSLTGTDRGNYVFPTSQTTTTATITRKPLSVSATKVYDGTVDVLNGEITVAPSSYVGSETLNLAGDATVNSKDVVTAAQLSDVSALVLSDGTNGGLAANYRLPDTISATVTPKAVVVDFTRQYDTRRGAALADMTLTDGAVTGESLSLVLGSGSVSTAALNRANVTLATGFSTFGNVTLAAGADTLTSNYQLPAPADVNVNITPVALSPGYSAETKVYDGDTTVPGVSLTKSLTPFPGTSLTITYAAAAYNDKDVADATTVTYTGGQISAVTDATPSNGAPDNILASDFTLSSSVDVTGTITPLEITGDDLYFQTSGALSSSVTVSGTDADFETLITGEALSLDVTGVSISQSGGNWYATNAGLASATINVNGSASGNYSLITTGVSDDYLVFGGQTLLTIAGTSSIYQEVYDSNTTIDNSEGFAFAWPSKRDLPEAFWQVVQVSDNSVIANNATIDLSGFLTGPGGGPDLYYDIYFDAAYDAANASDSANISVTNIRYLGTRATEFNSNYQFIDGDIAAKITRRPISVETTIGTTNIVAKEFDGTGSIASEVSSTFAFASTPAQNEGVVGSDSVSLVLNGDILAKERVSDSTYNATTLVSIPDNQMDGGRSFWASLGDFDLSGADASNYELEFDTSMPALRDNSGDPILVGNLFIAPQAVSVSVDKTYDGTPVIEESDFSVSGPSGTDLTVAIANLDITDWEFPGPGGGAPDPDNASQRTTVINQGLAANETEARAILGAWEDEYTAAGVFIAQGASPVRTGVVSGSNFSSAYGVADALSVTLRRPPNAVGPPSSELPVSLNDGGSPTNDYCAFDCISLSNYGVFANTTALTAAKTEQTLTDLTDGDYSTQLLLADSSMSMSPLAITVTPDAGQSKAAGTSDPTFSYSAGTVGSDTLTGNLGRSAGENAGNYAFTLGNLSNPNYTLTLAAETFEITASALPSVSLTGVVVGQKTYDSSASGSASLVTSWGMLSGFGSDDVTLDYSNVSLTYASEDVGTHSLVIAGLALAGTDAANYQISDHTTTGEIVVRDLTISGVTAANKVYDGNATATADSSGIALTGLVLGDDLAFDSATATFANADAGTGKQVNLSTTLTGTDLANYNVIQQATTTADITARPITVTANSGRSKVYGDADPSLTFSLEANSAGRGLVSGDTFSGALTRASGENVGTYAITQGTVANSNYTINYVSDDLSITARPITVTADSGQSKVYGDADPSLTYSLEANSAGRGLVSGDTFSGALTRASGENVGSYAITQGTVANSNYAISFVSDDLDITPKTVSASSNATVQKVYDGTNSATGATVSLLGVIDGDDVDLSSTGGTFSQTDVGTNLDISVNGLSLTGTDRGNYSYSGGSSLMLTGAGTITPKGLTLSGVSIGDKVYDATRSASVDAAGTLTGLIASDVGQVAVDTTNMTALFSDKNVGASKAVSITGGSLTGLRSQNYTLESISDSTGNITQLAISISGIVGIDRAYDQTTNAQLNTNAATGWLAGDDIGLQVTGTFADAEIGQNKPIALQSQYTGIDATNYVITDQAQATASILAARAPISSNGRYTILGSTGARVPNVFTLEPGVQPTYRSSDPSVVIVDPVTGQVTVVGPGQAELIADVPASGIYAATTERVQITVNDNSLADPFSVPEVPSVEPVFPEGRQPITSEQRAELERLAYDPEPEARPGVQRLGTSFEMSSRSVTNPAMVQRAISQAIIGQLQNDQVTSFVFNTTEIGFGEVQVVRLTPGDGEIVLNLATDVLNHVSAEEQLAIEFGVDELPEWMSFNEETGELTIDIPLELEEALELSLVANDQDGNAAATSIVIAEQADVQDLATFESVLPLNPTVVEVGNRLNYEVPPETFTHENANEQIRFEATLANNEPLPSWISFDAASKTFTGTPPETSTGQLDVIVTAIDSAQQKVQSALRIQLNDS